MDTLITELDTMQLLLIGLGVLIVFLPLIIIPRRKKVIRAGSLLEKSRRQPLSDADDNEIKALFGQKAYEPPEPFMPVYYQWIRKMCLAGFVVFAAAVLYMLIALGIPPILFDTYPDGDVFINSDAMLYFAKILAYYATSAELYLLSLKSLMLFYHASYKELLRDRQRFS